MPVTQDNIKKIVDSSKGELDGRIKRQEYYIGRQDILKEGPWRLSGQPRQLTVTNYIKYITDQHTAFSVSNPINYVSTIEENPALEGFNEVYKDKMLSINDNENFKNAFITGLSVEVVSFTGNDIKITNYNPSEWIMLRDPDQVLKIAIHISMLAKGTYVDGEILQKELTVYTVYDEFDKITYIKDGSGISEIEREPHRMGEVPVVDYQVQAGWKPAVTESLMQQQDVYNLLESGNIDDVLYNVDALLVLTGYQAGALTERPKDDQGNTQASVLEELSDTQTLALEEDGKAEFISKGNTKDKIQFALETSKKQLHLEGQVVDIDEITGATGVTSGIALRLKFQTMGNAASTYTAYFEKGLRKRIDLINIINSIVNESLIEDYKIVFTYNIPVNDLEIIKEATNLNALLDQETALSMLSFVENPKEIIEKRELERGIQEEKTVLDSIEEEKQDDLVINIV